MGIRRFAKLKPAASIEAHFFTAALLWSGIGIYLIVRGFLMYGVDRLWPLLVALGIGTLKSYLLLDRTAEKNITRIRCQEDGACLGSIYTWKMWGFIVIMMLVGRLLRASGLSGSLVGLVYAGVGWALFLSSRLVWRQWRP